MTFLNEENQMAMPKLSKYIFSGHESFPCKTLWLKKGFDFAAEGNDFCKADAVVKLGVGKNMVSSIRFWMRAFGLTSADGLTSIARSIFDSASGYDPYAEDDGTIWILHFLLVHTGEATLYGLFFSNFQRERTNFKKEHVVAFVRRIMTENLRIGSFNENTVAKDVNVLLLNYMGGGAADENPPLLAALNLLRMSPDGKQYAFNKEGKRKLPPEILLFAILTYCGKERTIDYDTLQDIGIIFCLTDMELINLLMQLQDMHPAYIRYTDTAGIRQIQFLDELTPDSVLDHYYKNEKF